MRAEVKRFDYSREPAYFLRLTEDWSLEKFQSLWTIGNTELFRGELLALFCSKKSPGKIVVKSHDFVEDLRVKGVSVIGGFQTPVEKMCLEVLLKGEQPIVVCPPRGIQNMRVPPEWSRPVEEGRLLVISPFGSRHRRATTTTAELRNRFVAAAADRLFFLYASPGSRTTALAEELLACGRDIETFDMKENAELLKIGARRLSG